MSQFLKKTIVFDPSKCAGCKYCEMWCSFTHEGVFSPLLSRITVVKDDKIGLDYPIVCRGCDPAPCTKVCPSNALTRNEYGAIIVIDENCTGCGRCVEACPFGAIKMHPLKIKPLICDLCGDKEPVCVSKCPTNAIRLYPVAKIDLKNVEKIFDKAYRYAIRNYKVLSRKWGIHVE
ncbi:MAG: 4Fe-4S dicluster domain-containing protein [Candidatus Baldrarchaeia archaeon]